jgi:hypothetical protein
MKHTAQHMARSITSNFFFFPILISALTLGALLGFSGVQAFITALTLVLLEVTLSFDNAVVNARVLKNMPVIWQRRFLTWGILIAVVGTRIILPILIVSAVAVLSPIAVASLALFNPEAYSLLLDNAHHSIAAFGSAFLFMVSLKYFFDETKGLHWIEWIEKHFARWGNIEAIEMAFTLSILLILSFFVPGEQGVILAAGIIGVVLFVLMEGVVSSMNSATKKVVAVSGFASFMYLNALDSAFSLDGVVGAFAITSDIVIIAIGLGIGAYFVRAMTVYLVKEGTLTHLPYLEHGAHWAIFGLAGSMALSLVTHIPETVTAGIGILFIITSYISSIKERARHQAESA